VLGALLLAGASARAGTLTSATWHQLIDPMPGLFSAVALTRTTAQLGAAGSSTAASVAVSLSFPAFATTVFRPLTTPFDLAVRITQGGPQAITATPGMGSGAPGIPGSVVVLSAVHAGMGVNQSMFMVGVNTIVRAPLSHGRAGNFTGTFALTGNLFDVSIDFYAWTPGSIVFTQVTSGGVALPDFTAMGSFNLTGNGGGTVTLVSPARLSVAGAGLGGVERRNIGFVANTLTLHFVPEPGSLLLLGAGGLLLAVGVRRRPH
jgi:hypothetical protein